MAMSDDDPRAALRQEEGALAEFFDAGRAGRAELPPRLMAAILADAEAARRPPARAGLRPGPRAVGRVRGRAAGGRAAALALAGCFAVGMFAGALGAGSGLVDPVLWPSDTTTTAAAAASGSGDAGDATGGVDGFYDLAQAEG
ncbi:hypothetical protein [Amaricoccus sp.]|uniref:hypothetical protein n=1 Tax=Amaricoccus sp. TaxID=1872485 RepID=UPI001B419AEB|nr:hypothetical protein [Amaricoccus sp.]MBP7003278.1 hypothetical protein [Amaricoccus sp.]